MTVNLANLANISRCRQLYPKLEGVQPSISSSGNKVSKTFLRLSKSIIKALDENKEDFGKLFAKATNSYHLIHLDIPLLHMPLPCPLVSQSHFDSYHTLIFPM